MKKWRPPDRRGVGRPRSSSPEKKREDTRHRVAKHHAEQEWKKVTRQNSSKVIELETMHWLDLIVILVARGHLTERDVKNKAAIERANTDMLHFALDDLDELAEMRALEDPNLSWRERPLDSAYFKCHWWQRLPGEDNWRSVGPCTGKVRFAVTVDDAETLGIPFEDTRKLKEELEDIMYRHYTNIGVFRPPDQYDRPWGSLRYGSKAPTLKLRETKLEPEEPTWTEAEAKSLHEKAIKDLTDEPTDAGEGA